MAINGHATMLSLDAIPEPATPLSASDEFKIVDTHGDTIRPTKEDRGFMARLDAKATEKIELSRGTIWLVATFLVLAGVMFSYGGSLLGWARDDEAQRSKLASVESDVKETRDDVRDLKKQFEELQKVLQEQRVTTARKEGYELKSAEGDHGEK